MAGSLRDGHETKMLQHYFQNADVANIGDGTGLRGSSTPGSFFIALYTAAPTDSSPGTECTYTGYARIAVARSAAGFDVAGNNVSNAGVVTFGEMTAGGPQTALAFAICEADVEAVDDQIVWGDITSPGGGLVINNGIIPEFQANELDVNVD